MRCPHCHSEDTRVRRNQTTSLGYPLHFCRDCQRSFNERTGTPFNHIEVPRYRLSGALLPPALQTQLSRCGGTFLAPGLPLTHETMPIYRGDLHAGFHFNAKLERLVS
ncbi:MAG: hypothetical protein AAFW75_24335 [Cyanobacteria bacterium J06636_16]